MASLLEQDIETSDSSSLLSADVEDTAPLPEELESRVTNLSLAGAVQDGVNPADEEARLLDILSYSPDPQVPLGVLTGTAYEKHIGSKLRAEAEKLAVGEGSGDGGASAVDDVRKMTREMHSPLGAYAVSQREMSLAYEQDSESLGPLSTAGLVTGYLEEKISNRLQKEFKGKKLGSFGSLMLVPFRQSYAMLTADDKMLEKELLDLPSPKGAKLYQDTFEWWWNLIPEERIFAVDEVEDFAFRASGGNAFLYFAFMDPFLDQEKIGDLRFDTSLDLIDLTVLAGVGIGPKIARMRELSRANTALRNIEKSGNTPLLGETVAKALDDKRLRSTIRTTPQELAEAALPGIPKEVVPGRVSGAEPTALEIFEQTLAARAKEVRTKLDDAEIPERTFTEEHEARKLQEAVLGDLKNASATNATIIETNPTGFVVQFDTPIITTTGLSISSLNRRIRKARAAWDILQENIENFAKAAPGQEGARQKALDLLRKDQKKLEKELLVYLADKKKLAKSPTHRMTVHYGRNEAGELEGALIKGANAYVSSSEVLLKDILKSGTGQASAIDFNIEKARRALASAWKEATRGVPRAERDAMDALLIAGDELGQVWTPTQLLTGVAHGGRISRLKSGASVQSYYLQRLVWDELHKLKNQQILRDLEFNQFRSLVLKGWDKLGSKTVFARPIDDGILPHSVRRIWDANKGELVDVDAGIRKRLSEGREIPVRIRTPLQRGKESFSYAIVNANTGLKKLPGQVLNYAKGYIPRIHKNVFYIVEKLSKRIVDGNEVDNYPELVRYFDNKAEAEAWAVAKQAEKGERYQVMSSRDLAIRDPGFANDVDIKGYGGLFSDERTDGIIFKGWNDVPPERITAAKSLEAYVNHIAVRYPINEFRLNLISKYLNTYGRYLENPNDWLSDVSTKAPGMTADLKKSMETVRNKFQDFLHMPTNHERKWQAFSYSLGDLISKQFPRKGKPVYTGLYKLGNIDPLAEARSAAFHLYLGWFNPRQLFVQAMGSAVVMGAHPVSGTKAVSKYIALRATMYSRNQTYINIVGDTLAKLGFMNRDEFVQLHREFRLTGLPDSVRTTADYGASSAGLPIGSGIARRTLDLGLVPFREGELVVRSMAWLVARDLYLKKNKLKKLDTIDQIDAVTRDSLHLSLNLNRANRAGFQQGIAALPTQFWQVMTKFAEALLPKAFGGTGQFTTAQKIRVLTIGTVIPFGVSGLPWGEWVFGKVAGGEQPDPGSPFFGITPEFLRKNGFTDDDILRLTRGGLLEYVVHGLTGADVELSSRVSIPAGVEELVSMWFDGDHSIAIIAAGAFGQIPVRVYQHAGIALELLGQAGKSKDMAPELVKNAMLEVAKTASSWSNWSKANWWWEAGHFSLVRRDGTEIFIRDLDRDEDWATVVAGGMGFQPRDISDTMDLRLYTRAAREALVTERVNAIVSSLTTHYPADGKLTQSDIDYAGLRVEMILMDVKDPLLYQEIMKQASEKMLNDPKMLELITETHKYLYESGGVLSYGSPADPTSVGLNPLLLPENIRKAQ